MNVKKSRGPLSIAVVVAAAVAGAASMTSFGLSAAARASTPCAQEFAPQEGIVASAERPFRDELCLNGRWQFQPAPIPAGYVWDKGITPDLTPPVEGNWDASPIKIPSPWNVNIWGGGRNVGAGSEHPYWPSSITYPSYPASWEHVDMAWMRRGFRVPAAWTGKRIILHFEAVAGDCQVVVNGQAVGSHFDSYTPFEFDVTSFVHGGAENAVQVGVRDHRLFRKDDARYPHARNPFPNGSNTEPLVGIWQDVSLIAVDPVHISDAFVQPLVKQDRLVVAVTVTNSGPEAKTVMVGGTVAPWVNEAGKSVDAAPLPKGRLDKPVLTLTAVPVTVAAGSTATVMLEAGVHGKLKLWSPDAPNLNGLVLTVADNGKTIDRHYTRFGWRQVAIDGKYLTLNGVKTQMFGDLVHPFGTFAMSRRYAWAWYRMIKDMHGNAVRIHAQPMPRFYLDLADEMGLLVLDETALFGSSLNLNFAEPIAWTRFADHYDGLVLRDRNHPSVFGWSFGNELFAIFDYNKVGQPVNDQWHAQLTELGRRACKLDPTRQWISCDGDEDLKGTLPVYSKHFGDGLRTLPETDKPFMVGESGGTYYAKPPRLVPFNGDRAYMSYASRDEALAIDAYQNVVKMARPELAFFSASETVWFGLEHLPFGYSDFSRLPNAGDGVVFTRPYEEGKPGWQPERISPYVATLNPGWDPNLPLYKPLAMFDAMKSALAPGAPTASPWDHHAPPTTRPEPAAPTIAAVSYAGLRDSPLHQQLTRWGAPLQDTPAANDVGLLIVDGAKLSEAVVPAAKKAMADVLSKGGIVLVSLSGADMPPAQLNVVNALLPSPIELSAREATMLVPKDASPWTAPLGMADLYFAEDPTDKRILKHGLTGPFVAQGQTLLEAANIDWTLFDAQESVKCSALVLYEHLIKPAGAAFVAEKAGGGTIAVTTIDTSAESPGRAALWRKLLLSIGVKMGEPRPDAVNPAGKPGEHNLLLDGPPSGK